MTVHPQAGLAPPLARHLKTIDFKGIPGTANITRSATAKRWMEAVRDQAREDPIDPRPGDRYSVRVDFRLGGTQWQDQEWDLDNLLKVFFDALTDVEFFGPPVHPRSPLKGDERVDHLEATKRRGRRDEELGARIEIWLIENGRASP
jgi:Holliday junction resolvase RusA-like endonuclease